METKNLAPEKHIFKKRQQLVNAELPVNLVFIPKQGVNEYERVITLAEKRNVKMFKDHRDDNFYYFRFKETNQNIIDFFSTVVLTRKYFQTESDYQFYKKQLSERKYEVEIVVDYNDFFITEYIDDWANIKYDLPQGTFFSGNKYMTEYRMVGLSASTVLLITDTPFGLFSEIREPLEFNHKAVVYVYRGFWFKTKKNNRQAFKHDVNGNCYLLQIWGPINDRFELPKSPVLYFGTEYHNNLVRQEIVVPTHHLNRLGVTFQSTL